MRGVGQGSNYFFQFRVLFYKIKRPRQFNFECYFVNFGCYSIFLDNHSLTIANAINMHTLLYFMIRKKTVHFQVVNICFERIMLVSVLPNIGRYRYYTDIPTNSEYNYYNGPITRNQSWTNTKDFDD